MDTLTLRRTGDAPLAFRGERIAEASSRRVASVERTRWFEATIYRRESGGYVVALAYRTRWQGEHDAEWAEPAGEPPEAAAALKALAAGALEPVRGYPPLPPYAERQERLLAQLRADLDVVIGDVLAAAGIVESLDSADET